MAMKIANTVSIRITVISHLVLPLLRSFFLTPTYAKAVAVPEDAHNESSRQSPETKRFRHDDEMKPKAYRNGNR